MTNFERMCEKHDFSYVMSDDHSVWQKGERSYADLWIESKKLRRSDAVEIFNRIAERKTGTKRFNWTCTYAL